MLGIGVILAAALSVAGYLSRQMRLARLKNDLIATVSHELKTPLSSMRVLVDTLVAGRCRDEQQAREYYQMIARENERLSRLIENFLTFSRMERNKVAWELVELDVGHIVSAAAESESVQERFSRPGCELRVDVAANLPGVRGDRDALVTVLLNLLDNAYKYTGDAKRIDLRARAEGDCVCLSVSDNGIGLSRRGAKRIFDRFYQADERLSRAAGGCGLGLSIVKFIVDAHGGAVDVASRAGEGSTFTVRLPAAPPAQP
jgi:signal transduction histidine kinase